MNPADRLPPRRAESGETQQVQSVSWGKMRARLLEFRQV
jgi:hypothetical protein